MIIEPLKEKFQPFTITVETQEEANLLAALVGALSSNSAQAFGIPIGAEVRMYTDLAIRTKNDFPDLTIKIL